MLAAASLLILCASGCHPGPGTVRPGGLRVVALHLEADPPDVEIILDDGYLGELNRWRDATLPTTPGLHRLELRRAGYFSLRREIEVGPDGTSFKATLRKQPDAELNFLPLPLPLPVALPARALSFALRSLWASAESGS